MDVVNMDEDFLMEDLWAKSSGDKTIDELREELEWKVAEYYDNYENLDEDEEPVIRPYVLYMLGYLERLEHFRWNLTEFERKQALLKIWQDRIYREEKRRNEKRQQQEAN